MMFAAPIFLYLLPLAGLPVLFHLFLKQKKRRILFPTLMFFYRTDPKLNSRRKIHQLLLLLMRVLLIALVLLALSRPRFQSALPMGGKVSVVAVVDNSGSMSDAPASAGADSSGGDKTKLDVAVEGAKRLIQSLGDSARMNMVTLVDDPAAGFGNVLTSDKDSLLTGLDKITQTDATGNAARALAKAFRLLRADSGRGGVVHIFTDLQEAEWLDDALQSESADTSIHVYLHRIASAPRKQPNVAISSVQLPRQKILPKHPMKVGVVCRNNSDAVATIRVNSIDDQDNKNTQQVVLEPGRTQVVEIPAKPEISGYHWLRAWIEGDGFSADNEAGVGILCQQTATVLFAGSRDEFGVLPTALSPDESGQITGIITKFGSIKQIPQAKADKPILIVTTWNGIKQPGFDSAALSDYVQSSGNLLIVPSANRIGAGGRPPAWLGADTKPRESAARGIKIDAMQKESDFWGRIREATENASLGDVRVFTFYPLQLSKEFTPLMGIDFEKVVLAHRTLGRGNIYVSGTAFDPRWNTLPLTGFIVVMAQSIAIGGASFDQDRMLSLAAGDYPKGIDAGSGQVEIVPLGGQAADQSDNSKPTGRIQWKGRAGDIPAFSQPGVFLIKAGEKEYCVSVRASEKEGLMQFIRGSQVPTMGRIAHTVVDYDPAEDLRKYQYGYSRTFELFLPFVLLATLALLAEGWLANPLRARSATTQAQGKHDIAEIEKAGDTDGRTQREFAVGRGAG
jgi:Aerotolerance regulator N-terminal/von Willebrand factor type A domain